MDLYYWVVLLDFEDVVKVEELVGIGGEVLQVSKFPPNIVQTAIT